MERIQVYPPDDIKELLENEAKLKKCSVSELTVEILQKYYGKYSEEEKPPVQAFYDDIFKEVETFIELKIKEKDADPDRDIEFDLLTASETFRKIHMVADGKPAMNRATIGRLFSSNVKNGWGIYRRVEAIKKPDGEPKSSVNRAQMYRITK